jgi:hypothetical protein
VRTNAPERLDRQLAALRAAGESPETWSIARDDETLRWMLRLERFEVASVAGRPDWFAILSRGNARELLLWNVPAHERRAGLAILRALLRASARDGAWIVSIPHALVGRQGAALRLGVRLLGFYRRRIELTIYAKSANPYFLEGRNLAFSRLFGL